ncbi:MAG: hypothetical protein FJ104_06950, partial [Deltaproteobacteria bacterium]|nr:hypothetical protein [Deltaproteobacteria bacterium]
MLAFELLTQRRLFVGGDRAVVQKVQRQKIPPLRGLSGVALPEVPAALA